MGHLRMAQKITDIFAHLRMVKFFTDIFGNGFFNFTRPSYEGQEKSRKISGFISQDFPANGLAM
jgi:hypothetical protein